jgi:outer membrane cobalamin receptor
MIPLVFLVMLVAQPIYELDEIVVTATRYPAALQDIALATVVIDKEELDKLNAISVGEVLQAYAGADIKDYGNPGSVSSISIRGIPANGTLVLVNGHPLNLITVGMADLSAININTVERIEIVKGPVSSLYGANGIGGAVNIITTKDYKKPEFKASFFPSTTDLDVPFQSKELFVKVGLPIGKTIFDAAGTYSTSDGFRDNSDHTGYYFTGALSYKPDKAQIISTFTYNSKDYGIPGPMLADSSSASLLDREKDNSLLGNICVKWDISDGFGLTNTFFADRRLIQFHTAYIGTGQDTVDTDYDYLTYTFGSNTMVQISMNSTEAVLGIDTHYDTLETTEISERYRDTVWNASSYNIGAWLELKHNIGHFIFTPSIRFDWNSRYDYFLSPAVGLVTPILDNLWAKISIGKAFRAPTFNDLFWPGSGNLDLKPEHGWAYELRFESSPSPVLFAALSLFGRSVKDRISWLPVDNGQWQPQNVNYISVKGLELKVNNQINEIVGIHLEGSYLYSRQENDEITYDFYDWIADTGLTIIEEVERETAFTPKYSASAKLDFNLPYRFGFNIQGLIVAEQFNYYANYDQYPDVSMDTKTLDSYLILNTSISKTMFKFLKLSVGAKNLFDQDYATQFGYTMNDLDYPMPGRTFSGRLSIQY